jgi:hypothetical protein
MRRRRYRALPADGRTGQNRKSLLCDYELQQKRGPARNQDVKLLTNLLSQAIRYAHEQSAISRRSSRTALSIETWQRLASHLYSRASWLTVAVAQTIFPAGWICASSLFTVNFADWISVKILLTLVLYSSNRCISVAFRRNKRIARTEIPPRGTTLSTPTNDIFSRPAFDIRCPAARSCKSLRRPRSTRTTCPRRYRSLYTKRGQAGSRSCRLQAAAD